jgi:hypothetical protein
MSRMLRLTRALLVAGGLGWATYSAAAWLRYGRAPRSGVDGPDPLDSFIADPEVDEEHERPVAASAALTMRTAKELELQRSPLVWLIFALRTLPARLRGSSVRWEASGLVEEMLGIGWGVLLDVPGELFVAGAVTQPWVAEVKFRALPPEEFAAFDDPGYAKIVWTLEADPLSEHESMARTRTRVKTTDPVARRRFRRYWAISSPGILLVRHELLRLVRQEATRLASVEAA